MGVRLGKSTFYSFLMAVLSCAVSATTIHVPAQQPTIQAGIDAASNGDTVLVAPGTYTEQVSYLGKSIALKSSGGADSTYWTATAPIVQAVNGEDSTCVLDGFTFQHNTYPDIYGGCVVLIDHSGLAIHSCKFVENLGIHSSSVLYSVFATKLIIENCLFENNSSEGGPVLSLNRSRAEINNNVFRGNRATIAYGGAIESGDSRLNIRNNLFIRNSAGWSGGALFLNENTDSVENNTFVENAVSGGQGGAISLWYVSPGLGSIARNIFYRNQGYAIWQVNEPFSFSCNDAYLNVPTDYEPASILDSCSFSVDPKFCFPNTGNFYLDESSPCAPNHHASGQLVGAFGIGCHACCIAYSNGGQTGNVDCDLQQVVDIADLSRLIDFLYIGMSPLCCEAEANIDGDPLNGIDISDLTRLIDYLYINFTSPALCQ